MKRETGKRIVSGTPKKEKRSRRLSLQQKLLIAVVVVLALALVGVLVWQSLFVQPELPEKEDPADSQVEEIDYGDGIRPKADGERKSKDFYTVLILGRDTGGGGNTDTMLLASYDVTNQKATVMSIPRDTMVNVPWDIKRINSVYNWYGGEEKGLNALYKEISQLVGFEPDYEVVVEWEAVGQIVEAIGGVNFDVPRTMKYKDPYQDLVINVEKGYQKLSGKDAMGVIRWRHDNSGNGYADGDLGRIKTQQAFLKAVVEQLLKVENITKINKIAKVFQECVETDLSFQNILWFAQSAYLGGLKVDNVNFVTMPNKNVSLWSRTVGNMQSYVVPRAKDLLELVNNDLSPFVEKSTMSELDIMSVNGDGSVSSTTGRVEDSKAAVPPVKPVKPAEVTPSEEGETGEETGEGTTTPPTGEPGDEPGGNTGGSTGGNTGGSTGGSTGEPGNSTGGATGGSTEEPTGEPTEEPTGETPTEPTDPGFVVTEPPPAE